MDRGLLLFRKVCLVYTSKDFEEDQRFFFDNFQYFCLKYVGHDIIIKNQEVLATFPIESNATDIFIKNNHLLQNCSVFGIIKAPNPPIKASLAW